VTWLMSHPTRARTHLERFGAEFDLSLGGYAKQAGAEELPTTDGLLPAPSRAVPFAGDVAVRSTLATCNCGAACTRLLFDSENEPWSGGGAAVALARLVRLVLRFAPDCADGCYRICRRHCPPVASRRRVPSRPEVSIERTRRPPVCRCPVRARLCDILRGPGGTASGSTAWPSTALETRSARAPTTARCASGV